MMSTGASSGPRRRATLEAVADDLERRLGHGVLRVAVDGVDGAGKTVFADELAAVLRGRTIAVIRASVDGFHNPQELRYRRGRSSPLGFFADSYDYASLLRLLLDPLGPGGDRTYVTAIHDVGHERALELAPETAPDGSVLVLDGIFLHRDELWSSWDYSVFLDVDLAVSVPRGAQRLGGADPDPDAESNRRYVEGQRLYLGRCEPRQRASVVIDNDVLADARIVARRRADREDGTPP